MEIIRFRNRNVLKEHGYVAAVITAQLALPDLVHHILNRPLQLQDLTM